MGTKNKDGSFFDEDIKSVVSHVQEGLDASYPDPDSPAKESPVDSVWADDFDLMVNEDHTYPLPDPSEESTPEEIYAKRDEIEARLQRLKREHQRRYPVTEEGQVTPDDPFLDENIERLTKSLINIDVIIGNLPK